MLAAMLTIETRGHDVAGARPQQSVGDHVQHAALHFRQIADRQHVEEQQVEQHVDRHDREGPDGQRFGHVAPRIPISSATYAAAFQPE